MEEVIKEILLNNSQSIFGMQIDENLIQFQKTRKDVEGDLTLVIFPFVKLLKSSPIETGEKIGAFLKSHIEDIQDFNVISGFLNFTISSNHWLNRLKNIDTDPTFGFAAENSKSTLRS